MDDANAQPSYRWYALTHVANLAFLAGAALGGAIVDPVIWLLAAPLELGALWVIPDLPPFQRQIDTQLKAEEIRRERDYCLEQLWGVRPRSKGMLSGLFGTFLDIDEEDPVKRVKARDNVFNQYAEMRQILGKLASLETVGGTKLVSREMARFEQVLNGYLRYQIACRSLTEALGAVDAPRLRKELDGIELQLKDAPPDLRAVLLESRRLRESQLERLPKLQATLELFRTRADAVVYQMRNLHGQVLADPGTDVNSFLEEIMEKHELLADPLGELEADQTVREMLHGPQSEHDAPGRTAAPVRNAVRQG